MLVNRLPLKKHFTQRRIGVVVRFVDSEHDVERFNFSVVFLFFCQVGIGLFGGGITVIFSNYLAETYIAEGHGYYKRKMSVQ